MRIIYASIVLCAACFFASCGGSKTEKEKVDVDQLVQRYCHCLETEEKTDSCTSMMITDALSLVSDKEAMATYNAQTEVCSDKRFQKDMDKAMDKLGDELEKKLEEKYNQEEDEE